MALAGIAASLTAVQAGLMRRAMDANIPLAEIDVGEVATGPNETCARVQPNSADSGLTKRPKL